MKRILVLLVALTILTMIPTAFAGTNALKPGDDFVYLDQANVLSEETEGEIYFANKQLYEKNGAMIVVVAADSLGGEDIFDYAYDLFNEWGIGDSKAGNGFLLLMAIQEDDYYSLTGPGLEEAFSSGTLKELQDTYLEPDFAKKDYDAGARKYFEAVYQKMAKLYGVKAGIADAKASYQAFVADSAAEYDSNRNASRFNANQDFGERSAHAKASRTDWQQPQGQKRGGTMGIIGVIIILLLIFAILSKFRGGSFFFWRPTFFWPIFGPRVYPRGWQPRRPPRGPGGFAGPGPRPFGGFRSRPTGGFSSRPSRPSAGPSRPSGAGRSFGGRRSGGFGGGFSGGGGRTFGGGAGRGRH